VSVHVPLQFVIPDGQPQTPPEQVCPLAHAFPQPPQLLASLLVSTHESPQAT
jgi:hypothetical protein